MMELKAETGLTEQHRCRTSATRITCITSIGILWTRRFRLTVHAAGDSHSKCRHADRCISFGAGLE